MDPTPTLQAPAPINWSGPDAVTRMRMEEFGTTRGEIAAERLEDARLAAREAMKILDAEGTRGLHKRAADLVLEIDNLRALLAERHGS